MSQQVISLRASHLTIDSALAQISNKTGHYFFYKSGLFARIPPIDLKLETVGWERALHVCLAGLDVALVAHGDSTTVIMPAAGADEPLQYLPLNGRVTGAGGQPLEGATVLIDGRQAGILTDARGAFHLPVDAFLTPVVISYAGYLTHSEVLSNKDSVNISLHLPGPLDAIVVLPYDNHTSRKLSTATVFAVQDTTIQDAPVGNLLEALQGRVPGVSIRQYNGVPGSAFEVLLGGRHSMQQGNDPLYIVDGVPLATNGFLSTIGSGSAQGANGASALNGIPMSAIGSISVMNDAAATALYGSRASNGVILVTLKEGRSGSPVWTADANAGISRTVPTSPLLNTPQFLQLRQEAIQNDGRAVNDTTLPERFKWDPNRYTDFKRMTTGGTGFVRNARVELTGGGPNDRFLVNGRFHKESSVYRGDFYDQHLSLYGNYHRQSDNRKLRLGVSALVNRENILLPLIDLSQYQYLAPNTPAFTDAAGVAQWGSLALPLVNIPAATNNAYLGKVTTVLGHGEVSYALTRQLFAEARIGYNGLFTREQGWLTVAGQAPYIQPAPVDDTTRADNDYNSGIVEGMIRYRGALSRRRGREQDQLDAVAGATYQTQQTQYSSHKSIRSGTGALVPGASRAAVTNRYTAYFGRVSYVFRKALILSAALRRDGSTKFGDGYLFGNFWSAGGAWIFRQEDPGAKGFSFGKIKASYGTTGNEQISPKLYDTTTVKMVNKNLRWESNHRAEAGLELGFLRDRLLFTAIAYRSWTDNQLIFYLANPFRRTAAHFAVVPANVVNRGLEFQLVAQGIGAGRFRWSTQLSVTVPANRLKSFPGLDSSSLASSLMVGHSLTARKGYHFLGVDPDSGLYRFQKTSSGALASVASPSLDPKWYVGWGNTLAYGRLELHLFFDWRRQNGVNPLAVLAAQNPPGAEQGSQLSNGPVEWLAHWRNPGDRSSQQRLTARGNAAANLALQEYSRSDGNVTGASYLRLKTLALAYRWTQDQLQRMPAVEGISVYLRGEDLWRVTRFGVTDPETQDPTVLPPMWFLEAGFTVVFGKKAGPPRRTGQ